MTDVRIDDETYVPESVLCEANLEWQRRLDACSREAGDLKRRLEEAERNYGESLDSCGQLRADLERAKAERFEELEGDARKVAEWAYAVAQKGTDVSDAARRYLSGVAIPPAPQPQPGPSEASPLPWKTPLRYEQSKLPGRYLVLDAEGRLICFSDVVAVAETLVALANGSEASPPPPPIPHYYTTARDSNGNALIGIAGLRKLLDDAETWARQNPAQSPGPERGGADG